MSGYVSPHYQPSNQTYCWRDPRFHLPLGLQFTPISELYFTQKSEYVQQNFVAGFKKKKSLWGLKPVNCCLSSMYKQVCGNKRKKERKSRFFPNRRCFVSWTHSVSLFLHSEQAAMKSQALFFLLLFTCMCLSVAQGEYSITHCKH